MWSVSPEWKGETAFIIAGGPSVAREDLSTLAGRKVIAINSSYEAYPAADILFFGDSRWWGLHRPRIKEWPGRIVTCAPSVIGNLHRMHRIDATHGLANLPDTVALGRTSLQAAINLAVHLGSPRIVLIGADMGPSDGRTHHHSPHPWPQRPGCWDEQIKHLGFAVPHLERLGVEVINTNPASRLPWWRKQDLASLLSTMAA